MDINRLANIKIEESYVAFVDILGFKEKIMKCNDLKDVALISFIFEEIGKAAQNDLRIFLFSDCMYIVGKCIEKILELIACLQIQLLGASELSLFPNKEYTDINLLRGGITKGELIAEQSMNIILGSAVNKAYSLENEIAIYPRIVFDPSCIDCCISEYVKKDIDDIHYFDFIKFLREKKQYSISSDDITTLNQFYQKYTSESDNLKIIQKYGWFINYLNNATK